MILVITIVIWDPAFNKTKDHPTWGLLRLKLLNCLLHWRFLRNPIKPWLLLSISVIIYISRLSSQDQTWHFLLDQIIWNPDKSNLINVMGFLSWSESSTAEKLWNDCHFNAQERLLTQETTFSWFFRPIKLPFQKCNPVWLRKETNEDNPG